MIPSLNMLPPCSQVLQSEGLASEEELCRLRSQAELHRMQTTVIATLEGERAALERDRDALRSATDALRTAHRKVEENTATNTQTRDASVTPNASKTAADVIFLQAEKRM